MLLCLMLLCLTFLLTLLFSAPTNPYRAIVVDATTSQPLANVTVVDLQGQGRAATDAAGRFDLPGPGAYFRLHRLGFADLEATRPALTPGQVDTLRLLPEAILLTEVSVRPAKPLVLSSIGSKPSKPYGSILAPGTQFGVLFRPTASMLPAIVQRISVRFQLNKQSSSLAGRVRVRLVAPEQQAASIPSAYDLVPIAATYTAAELAALPDHLLTVDLSAYNIRLPATGFFVLLEGLPTIAGETFVTDKIVGDAPRPGAHAGSGTPVVVTASDPQNPATFHETSAFDFPAIVWVSSITDVQTVTRRAYNKPWRLQQQANRRKTDNLDIALTILAD